MKKIVCCLFIAFGFGACSLNNDSNDSCGDHTSVPFTAFPFLCNYSVNSIPNNAAAAVVNSQEELDSNFTQHDNTCPTPSDPNIDFTKNFLIGVYAGAKPTSGYEIVIGTIFENDCQLLVNYYEKSPLPGDTIVNNEITYPTDFALIPATSKPIFFNKTNGPTAPTATKNRSSFMMD